MKKINSILLSLCCCNLLQSSEINENVFQTLDTAIKNSNINVNKNTNNTESIIINKIVSEGLDSFSINYIIEVLKIPYNTPISPILVRQKIEELMKLKKFESINIEYVDTTLKLLFIEHKKISAVSYKLTDNVDLSDKEKEQFELYCKITPGQPFIKKYIEQYQEQVIKYFTEKGYVKPILSLNIIEEKDMSLTLELYIESIDKLIVKKVSFTGNEHSLFLDDKLEDLTENHSAQLFPFLWGRSNGDFNKYQANNIDQFSIETAYKEKGFLDVKVEKPEITYDKNDVSIHYNITEGIRYKISDIKFIGLPPKLEKSLLVDIYENKLLHKDDFLTSSFVHTDKNYLQKLLMEHGYINSNIKLTENKKEDGSLELTFNIIPGEVHFINDIYIKGNTKTLDNVIRRSLYMMPGEQFNIIDFEDSVNSLNRQGLFGSANITKKPVEGSKNKIDLVVNITETKTGNLSIGGGYGSYEGFIFDSSISERNFLGTGYQLQSSVSKSDKELNYNIGLVNPGIFNSHISGNVNFQNTNSEAIYDNYIIERISNGYSFGLGYKYNRYTNLNLTFKHSENSDTYIVANTPDKTENYITQLLIPTLSFNNTDNYQLPRKGFNAAVSIEYAGFKGDTKYYKTNSYVKYFKDLSRIFKHDLIFRNKTNLKTLVSLGKTVDGSSFSLGGANSVRGYQSYAFSNSSFSDPILNRYITNSTELSFKLSDDMNLRGLAFLDVGALGHNDFSKFQKAGMGLGLEWFSPMGPIQIIYAKPIKPGSTDKISNFEIQIGNIF